jgi:hypothetical protein
MGDNGATPGFSSTWKFNDNVGTITLTNAGSIGGLFATPVINYPEVAILGFNKIFRKPVVKTVARLKAKGAERARTRAVFFFNASGQNVLKQILVLLHSIPPKALPDAVNAD